MRAKPYSRDVDQISQTRPHDRKVLERTFAECPLMALSGHSTGRVVMSAFGNEADMKWCCDESPLLTRSEQGPTLLPPPCFVQVERRDALLRPRLRGTTMEQLDETTICHQTNTARSSSGSRDRGCWAG